MSEQRPSAYTRAEVGARQLVMQLGLGVCAFLVGSIFAAGLAARLTERLGTVEGEGAAWFLHVLFERLWLGVAAPAVGYLFGRFTEQPAVRVTLRSVLAGETFSVLLVSGRNGFEYLFDDAINVTARLVTLVLGLWATYAALQAGRADAGEAQAEADAVAAKQKAEYAAMLEGAAPAGPPHAAPRPSGGEGEVKPGDGPSS